MNKRPGGELANRPLHFIWICDCSGSMSVDGKIQALNHSIRESIEGMQDEAKANPNAQVYVRAIKFSDGATWHITNPVTVEDFKWDTDLDAQGATSMGKALSMVADQLKIPPMTSRALPPVLVLISDGQPTDDFNAGLNDLMAQPWGVKAVRVAIAIGLDADLDVLQKFIGNPEIKPLHARNPEALVKMIKWVSTVVLKAASQPPSQPKDASGSSGNVIIPTTAPDTSVDVGDVW